jgi:hypothetical protein
MILSDLSKIYIGVKKSNINLDLFSLFDYHLINLIVLNIINNSNFIFISAEKKQVCSFAF